MRASVVWVLLAFEQFVLLYFFAINTSYLVCSVLAFFRLRQHRHRWTTRELESVVQSPATPGVSVIAPAYNEQATIVESMRALLLLNYPQFEVICSTTARRTRRCSGRSRPSTWSRRRWRSAAGCRRRRCAPSTAR